MPILPPGRAAIGTPTPSPPLLWTLVLGGALVAGGIGLAAGVLFVIGFLVDAVLWASTGPLGVDLLLLGLVTFAAFGISRVLAGRSPPSRMAPFH